MLLSQEARASDYTPILFSAPRYASAFGTFSFIYNVSPALIIVWQGNLRALWGLWATKPLYNANIGIFAEYFIKPRLILKFMGCGEYFKKSLWKSKSSYRGTIIDTFQCRVQELGDAKIWQKIL